MAIVSIQQCVVILIQSTTVSSLQHVVIFIYPIPIPSAIVHYSINLEDCQVSNASILILDSSYPSRDIHHECVVISVSIIHYPNLIPRIDYRSTVSLVISSCLDLVVPKLFVGF